MYIRNGLKLKPFILGGGQENGLRSGHRAHGADRCLCQGL